MSTTTLAEPKEKILNGTSTDQPVGKVVPTDILTRIRHATPSQGMLADVLITPSMAEKILTLNTVNRRFRKGEVKKHVETMLAGKWVFTGDVIRISREMKLLDGQHKLQAIVESGTKQRFNIQCGLDPDAFSVIDTGKLRSAGDTLSAAGISNYNVTAAAIKAYIYFKTKGAVGANLTGQRVSNQTVASWLGTKDMVHMQEAVREAVSFYHPAAKFIAHSTWAFLHYLLTRIHKGHAEDFLASLATGEDISRTKFSPIYFLREKLISLQNRTVIEPGRMMEVRIKYIITAWNHYRRDEQIPRLVVDLKTPGIPKPI